MDNKIIQLDGVRMEDLSTPEGLKKARRIFARNMNNLLKTNSAGDEHQTWVLLQPVHPSSTAGTSQQYSDASALLRE